jgi:hypothetical protein
MLSLQNYTNSENTLVGPCAEAYPASHDANQAMGIKSEEVSDAQEDVDPVGITIQEINSEPEVSCMFLYIHCWADITDVQKCQLSFLSGCHMKQLHCAADWALKTVL